MPLRHTEERIVKMHHDAVTCDRIIFTDLGPMKKNPIGEYLLTEIEKGIAHYFTE